MNVDKNDIEIYPLFEFNAEQFYKAVELTRDNLNQWFSWSLEYTLEDAKQRIDESKSVWENDIDYRFAILHKKQNLILGCVGMRIVGPYRVGNLGYWVGQKYQGNHLAAIASKLLADYAFGHLTIQRIEIMVLPENIASIKTAEKMGAKFEGLLRHRLQFKEQPWDALCYSLLPKDIYN